jgi:hypothetical protein
MMAMEEKKKEEKNVKFALHIKDKNRTGGVETF